MKRNPERPEGTESAATLLEGKAGGRVDDEEADNKGKEAEGGKVEVETVGEPSDIGLFPGIFKRKFGRNRLDGFKTWPLRPRDDDPAQFAVAVQQAVRDPNVYERRALRKIGGYPDRNARGVLETGCGCRRHYQLPWTTNEIDKVGRARNRHRLRLGWHAQRIDAD